MILDEAIALFDNGNYSGQTVKKMLRELKDKMPGERGCLTCYDSDCTILQAADQNCWKSMEQHDKEVREKVLDELVGWIQEYQSGRDSAYMEVVLTPVLEKIAELRKGGRAND